MLTDDGMLSSHPIGIFDDKCDHPTIGVEHSPRPTVDACGPLVPVVVELC